MANKRITELQLISAITDSCNFPLDDTTQTYRATSPQFLEYLSSKGMPYTWDSAKTYASGDFVIYLGNIYVSLQGTNTNQNPATQPTFWVAYLFKYGVSAKSADYTITTTDNIRILLMTTGGTDRTITLPDATVSNGRPIRIKKVDGLDSDGTGKLTIASAGSDTIGGAASQLLFSAGDCLEIVPNGTDWNIIKMRQIEFVSNSNTTNANDTSAYAFGPAGNLVPNRSVGTAVSKDVQWLSSLLADDSVETHINGAGTYNTWLPVAMFFPYTRAAGNSYGISASNVSATITRLTFNVGGSVQTSGIYGNNGAPWSDDYSAGTKWRLVKKRII